MVKVTLITHSYQQKYCLYHATNMLTTPMQEPNQEKKKKKKKKSRGDRKAQHKRRRLRRQLRKGNDNQTVMEPDVVGLHNDHKDEEHEQQIEVG
jgi:hypothetical protein